MASAKDILFNEDGTYKTTAQYIAEIEAADSADLMADMLILKGAVDVIKKWRKGETDYAANVAMAQCALMASDMSQKLYREYGVIAS